jgi:hypothetical protein
MILYVPVRPGRTLGGQGEGAVRPLSLPRASAISRSDSSGSPAKRVALIRHLIYPRASGMA